MGERGQERIQGRVGEVSFGVKALPRGTRLALLLQMSTLRLTNYWYLATCSTLRIDVCGSTMAQTVSVIRGIVCAVTVG